MLVNAKNTVPGSTLSVTVLLSRIILIMQVLSLLLYYCHYAWYIWLCCSQI